MRLRNPTMLVTSSLWTPTLILVMNSGCQECDDYYEPPSYRIAVFDAGSRTPICDADVSVNEYATRRSTTDCTYVMEIPPGDSAEVRVSHEGYKPTTLNVATTYEKDSCDHPIEVKIEVNLERLP
ncbi:MAG TPA: hypothetical protein PLF11_16275 [Bacillota bacterium]|jgi:hypothetical protein|nr:MAG: hypothetical protein BWY17_05214 [Deltaproteobacteria bacterium ADurb.Bin207]HOI38921.1 hypothetical protein [Bacillota bacterium]